MSTLDRDDRTEMDTGYGLAPRATPSAKVKTAYLVAGGVVAIAIIAGAAVLVSRNEAVQAQAAASIPAAATQAAEEAAAAARIENSSVNAQIAASQAAGDAAAQTAAASQVVAANVNNAAHTVQETPPQAPTAPDASAAPAVTDSTAAPVPAAPTR